jgi:hypothetical protein
VLPLRHGRDRTTTKRVSTRYSGGGDSHARTMFGLFPGAVIAKELLVAKLAMFADLVLEGARPRSCFFAGLLILPVRCWFH